MAFHNSDLSSQPSAVIKNTTDETIEVRTYDAFDNVQWKSKWCVSIKPHEEEMVFGAEGAYHTHFYAYVYLGNKHTAWPGYMVQPGNVYEVHSSESEEPTLKFSFAPFQFRSDLALSQLQEAKRRCILAGRDLLTIREDSTISGIESLLVALNKRYTSVGVAKTTSSAGAIAGTAMVAFPATMPAGLMVLASSALGGVLSSSAKNRGSSAEAMNFQQLHAEDMAATEKFREALEEYDQMMQTQFDIRESEQPGLRKSNAYDKTMVGVWSAASGGVGWGATEATVLALSGGTRIVATAFGAALAGVGALVMIADTAHSWANGKVNEEMFNDAITKLKESNEMISQVLDSLQMMSPDEASEVLRELAEAENVASGNSNAMANDEGFWVL